MTKDISDINQSLRLITDRLSKLEKPSSPAHGTPLPASLLADPLTKALAKLSGDEPEEGRILRPETYAQSDTKDKNRDYSKLDVVDLMYGWVSIAEQLLTSGGDIHSYIRHIKFASEMLHTRRVYCQEQSNMTA